MEKCDILVSVLVWKRRCHSHGCMLDREAMPRPFRWTTVRSYFRQNSQSQLVVNLLRYETVKLVSNTETHDRHFVSLLQLSIWPGLDLIIKPFRANVTAMLMTYLELHTQKMKLYKLFLLAGRWVSDIPLYKNQTSDYEKPTYEWDVRLQ